MVRRVWLGVATATLVFTSPGAALASGDPDGSDGHGNPEPTGEWTPVHEDYYMSFDTEACGTVVTVSVGDVREVEQRERVLRDGTTFVEYRGGQTADVLRHSDGAFIDELDVSGPGWNLVSPDGSEIVFTLDGPSLVGVHPDEPSREAFEAAGLPPLFYYGEGSTLARVVVDPETGETLEAAWLQVDAEILDLCDVLDDAAAGHDDEEHHDGDHHDGDHHDSDHHDKDHHDKDHHDGT